MLVPCSVQQPLWHLLRAKPKQENRVVRSLGALGVEGYCPLIVEPRLYRWEPTGPVPMFPGYVFALFVASERFAEVHYCSGAAGLVRFGQRIAAVEDLVVKTLREGEGSRGYIEVPRRELAPGKKVRVVKGALTGVEGVITHYMPARQRIRFLMRAALGGNPVEIDASWVRSA